MAIRGIGSLHGADEGLNHQIVDTFATVSESDYSWTEKIWVSVASADGSVQLDFGLGKYHNRGVIDGFAGISRGREQWIAAGPGPPRAERCAADLFRCGADRRDAALLRRAQPGS